MPTTTTAPIKYDTGAKQFRYADSGQFASREAVIYQTSKYIRQQQKELVGLTDAIYADPTNTGLQRRAGELLRNIHVANASIAAKGSDKMYANDYLVVATELKRQYGLIDNYPQEYGVNFLFNDVATGKTSRNRLADRLEMYALSGKASYFAVEVNKATIAGATEAKRVLGYTDRHCKECVRYSQLGWQALEDVILPTKGCSCYTRCKCSLQFREAI